MRYQFYIMGRAEGENGTEAFGLGYNHKRYIRWMYNLETGKIDLFKSVAGESFMEQLKEFILPLKEDILFGEYDNIEERREVAIDILSGYVD
jgi:hypothetical protein